MTTKNSIDDNNGPDPDWTSFDAYDLTESIGRIHLPSKAVRVAAACGRSPEGCGSWEGGFVLLLADARWALITGWCDTTGWGCQDGATLQLFDDGEQPSEVPNRKSWDPEFPPIARWTQEPAALAALQKALDEYNAENAKRDAEPFDVED